MKQIKSAVTANTHTQLSCWAVEQLSSWAVEWPASGDSRLLGTYSMAFHFWVVNICCRNFTTLNHKRNTSLIGILLSQKTNKVYIHTDRRRTLDIKTREIIFMALFNANLQPRNNMKYLYLHNQMPRIKKQQNFANFRLASDVGSSYAPAVIERAQKLMLHIRWLLGLAQFDIFKFLWQTAAPDRNGWHSHFKGLKWEVFKIFNIFQRKFKH